MSKRTSKTVKKSTRSARASAATPGGEARLNVTLPVTLHSKVKMRAAERRLSIRSYIIELLRRDGVE